MLIGVCSVPPAIHIACQMLDIPFLPVSTLVGLFVAFGILYLIHQTR
jgi:hypothetical protein